MTSLPVGATQNQSVTQTTSRNGDAAVVRGFAAGLVILALVALIVVVERPAAYGVAATIVLGALGLFWAARWRRVDG